MHEDESTSTENLDEVLERAGEQNLSELLDCTPGEVVEAIARSLPTLSAEQATEAARRLAGVAGAIGALVDALADGAISQEEELDLGAISGEASADLTDLMALFLAGSEASSHSASSDSAEELGYHG